MTCEQCEQRRIKLQEALLSAKIIEAARHAITGAADLILTAAGRQKPMPTRATTLKEK